MATRLYLRATTASEPKPNAKQSGTSITQWMASTLGGGQDSASTIYPLEMLPTIGSDNIQGIGQTLTEPGAIHYAWYKAWISPPLAYDQVIEGTLTFVADFVEGAAAHNLMPRILGYVWKGNDSGVRGVFLADTNSAVEADLTPATLQTFLNAIALTPVNAQIGDRIVIEVMSWDNNSKTLSYAHSCNFDGAGGSNRESYFLFSKTFEFSWDLANNVYAKLAGDDANVGYSWATAKQTINAGINTVNVGGTLHIGFGDYSVQPAINLKKTMDLLCETADIGGGNGTVILPSTLVPPWVYTPKYIYPLFFYPEEGWDSGELFIYDGQLKLILTDRSYWGNIRGFYHDGDSWVEEPKWVNGLTAGDGTKDIHFWKDGLLHLLECHSGWADITGKVWNPSLEVWESEDTYLNGLLPGTNFRAGDIWFDNGVMNLIVCDYQNGATLAFTWNPGLLTWERNTFYEGVRDYTHWTVFKFDNIFRLLGYYDAPTEYPNGYTLTPTGWVPDDSVIDGLTWQSNAKPALVEYQGQIILCIGDWRYWPGWNTAYTREVI